MTLRRLRTDLAGGVASLGSPSLAFRRKPR